jgi:hypothetical protein
LPACPTGAISLVELTSDLLQTEFESVTAEQDCCPLNRVADDSTSCTSDASDQPASYLRNWPIQIKLANPKAPVFEQSDLLISADCCAYAFADFHSSLMAGKVTLIGCPKLDDINYTDKLTEILQNDISSVTVCRMEVPCCRGIVSAVEIAVRKAGKSLPIRTMVISTDGSVF